MKQWIVAGASRGIGSALIESIDHSDKALGLARQSDNLKKIDHRLIDKPNKKIEPIDLQDEQLTYASISNFIDNKPEQVILVNCAATWTGGKTTLDSSAEDYKNAFSLNFITAVNTTNAVMKHWNKSGRSYPITIINLGATASTRGGIKTSSFAVSKSALRIYSQSIAREFGPQGVHVCHIIIDGLINNRRTKKLNEGLSEDQMISQYSLMHTIFNLAQQKSDCWTFELDIRPLNEKW